MGVRSFRCVMLLALLASAGTFSALAQTSSKQAAVVFRAKDYPAERFRISKREYPFRDLTIRVINVKTTRDIARSTPHYCSSWVEVLRGQELLKRMSYPDIEPVGFSFGAFVPKKQPPDYFAVVKEGDYDGRLLLINSKGEVIDIPGGLYFLTADKRYVVSEYASDESEITVFDLSNQRIVLQPTDTPELGHWYHDDSGYFVMEYQDPGHAERLDLEHGRMVRFSITDAQRKKAARISYDFDPRTKQDCSSAPE